MSNFVTETSHTAKKKHICYLCNQTIRVGDKYFKQVGKFYDNFYDIKMHSECYTVLQDYWNDLDYQDKEEVWTIDYLRDYWIDNKCYNCKLNEINGGYCYCEQELDRNCWCTKFEFLYEGK